MDGSPGPAQSVGAGRGLPEVKEIIGELENGEDIEARYIDPALELRKPLGARAAQASLICWGKGKTRCILSKPLESQLRTDSPS